MKKVIARNKKARFNYEIEDDLEAGIALLGSEVKSVRAGHVSLDESYVMVDDFMQASLIGCNIKEYKQANINNHEPKRPRRLLLKKKELKKLKSHTARRGYSIVPLEIYFSGRLIKLKIALCRSKKKYDKRDSLKDREAARDIARIQKNFNLKRHR